MKAVICNSFGPIDSLSLENVEGFKSNEEEVEVEIKAAALNFPDVLMVEGKYQSLPKFPFSPGGEFAGIITKESNGDSRFKVGDAVFGATGHGCLAEKIALSPDKLRHKPEHMSFEIAAGLSTTYGTSYYALKQRGNLAKGETLLVLGAAGGVGLAAVQLGKAMGARVIAAASSREKLEIAKSHGADELIDYSGGELKEQVKSLTNGKGADVIYDPVGGELFDQCMRCINWYGRILVVGFVGGEIPRVPTNLILLKSCQVIGVFYGAFSARYPLENERNFQEILDYVEKEAVIPFTGKTFPLEEYKEALTCLAERRAIGKIVVKVQ